MAKKIREFMTHREPPEHIWMERDESAVIGTARMDNAWCRRSGRSISCAARRLPVTERARWSSRAIACGSRRNISPAPRRSSPGRRTTTSSICSFPGARRSKAKSGVVEVAPGEIVLVPAAISHRSTGSDECLRVRAATQEFVTEGVDPEKPTMQRSFSVRASEPMPASNGQRANGADTDPVLEHISFWDPQSDLWVELVPSEPDRLERRRQDRPETQRVQLFHRG